MIEIITNLDRYTYRVAVFRDGALLYTLPAIPGTVIKVRNRECERWAEAVGEVRAGAIPPIPGFRNGTGGR